jgi:hypothetical protein
LYIQIPSISIFISIVNLIDYTGKAYDDQFISNRSAHVVEGIAKDMGLQTAREVHQVRYKERQMEHPEIACIKQLAKATLAQREVNSIATVVSSFNQAGAQEGFRAEAYNKYLSRVTVLCRRT